MTFFMSVLLAVALGPVALVYLEGEYLSLDQDPA